MTQTKTYRFDCGCELPIENEELKEDGLPHIRLDIDEIRLDCPKTLQLFIDGKTKGIFQLENTLGKQWSKAVKPVNIEEISALISIIRPGCLQSKVDGRPMTKHFVDRKDGQEEYEFFHPEAEGILGDTYDVIIYQEQALALSKKFAGFSLEQADSLRKAIGKKNSSLMQEVRNEFVTGCKNTGIISEEQGTALFDIIEKSNRYSFNKCITPDTLVETKNGLMEVSNIKVGDFIKSLDDDLENEVFVEIIDKFDNGELEVFEVTLESGKSIKCTKNHKFLCDDGRVYSLYDIMIKNLKIITETD